MLQRKTQTASFWREQFELTDEDQDFLYALLAESQKARLVEELALALIQEYLGRESAHMQSELAKGEIYQPKSHFRKGQTLVFPILDFKVGEVVEIRDGHNPEHGEFEVISVRFGDTEEEREFAAGLNAPHRLNQNNGGGLLDESSLLSADEIFTLYQEEIVDTILFALEEGPRAREFVQVNDEWLLADMLADVHIGHLNIAEAMIEIAGRPMSSRELLKEVELESDASEAMQVLSLDHALTQDGRFDALGDDAQQSWYLYRLEPEVAQKMPLALTCRPMRYNRSLLSVELLQLEWELDDEWGESSLSSAVPSAVPNTSFTLTYPHWLIGSIPLSGRTSSFFIQKEQGRSQVTFIDGRWGNRIIGWAVHDGRYVCGLKQWFTDHTIPVGAYLTLERTNTAGEIVIDYRPRRPKREWSRIAELSGESGAMIFTMNKVQISCEYDDLMIVSEEDGAALAALRGQLDARNAPLDMIVGVVVEELIKLNPQGNVHAKTVYSAVNILRRCAPGPIFHALITNRKFQDLGGGLFSLA